MIVVLEGIDGSGKTTTAKLLVERLTSFHLPAVFQHKSTINSQDAFVCSQIQKLRAAIWPPPNEEPDVDALGTYFYLYLLAAWYSAVEKHVIPTLQQKSEIGVFDGWYFRTVAKAYLRAGLDMNWITSLFAHVTEADLVILLDVDPKIAWTRREKFKPTEIGRWDGMEKDPFEGFCSYQNHVREQLLEMASRNGWLVIHQHAHSTPEDTMQQIFQKISPSVWKAKAERSLKRVRNSHHSD